ncbi:MAG: transposase [Myxococcota bacterium]
MTTRIKQTQLDFHPDKPIDIRFDAPKLSSDGGTLLLRQVDDKLGLTKHFAQLLPDDRDPNPDD